MRKISIIKSVANLLNKVKQAPQTAKGALQKRALRREMLQGRYKSCDEFLLTIPSIINNVSGAQHTDLQKEYDTLQNDFDYICHHFKKSTPELDKRLEVVILKARTLKILAACQAAIQNPRYQNQLQPIQDLLEDIKTLQGTILHYADLPSAMIIDYKETLQNLEIKTATQLEDSGIHFTSLE